VIGESERARALVIASVTSEFIDPFYIQTWQGTFLFLRFKQLLAAKKILLRLPAIYNDIFYTPQSVCAWKSRYPLSQADQRLDITKTTIFS
jgi:hypothetical protein